MLFLLSSENRNCRDARKNADMLLSRRPGADGTTNWCLVPGDATRTQTDTDAHIQTDTHTHTDTAKVVGDWRYEVDSWNFTCQSML